MKYEINNNLSNRVIIKCMCINNLIDKRYHQKSKFNYTEKPEHRDYNTIELLLIGLFISGEWYHLKGN